MRAHLLCHTDVAETECHDTLNILHSCQTQMECMPERKCTMTLSLIAQQLILIETMNFSFGLVLTLKWKSDIIYSQFSIKVQKKPQQPSDSLTEPTVCIAYLWKGSIRVNCE